MQFRVRFPAEGLVWVSSILGHAIGFMSADGPSVAGAIEENGTGSGVFLAAYAESIWFAVSFNSSKRPSMVQEPPFSLMVALT